jgi:hypothetical protein
MTNIVVKVLESYEFWIFLILIAGFVIWPISLFIKEYNRPKDTSNYNSITKPTSYSNLPASENIGGKRKRNNRQNKRNK